ncbi:unnamed protein product [Rhodiola kirilowii]
MAPACRKTKSMPPEVVTQFFSAGVSQAKAAKNPARLNVIISSRYKLFIGFCP